MAEEGKNIEAFDLQLLNSGFSKSFQGEYIGSNLQNITYNRLEQSDKAYQEYIKENYGSYDNFLRMNRISQTTSVYDPNIHYIMDVTVITKDSSYKTDHISTQEVIMEALSGVCTIVFMKVDGSVGRITGTLDEDMVPQSQSRQRKMAFFPQQNDRVVIWDLNKDGWRSFYMSRVIKFVRDDTIGLE